MTIDVFVCRTCLRETNPRTIEAVKALSLIPETHGHQTEYVCPRCGEVVYVFYDFGEIEFGI